MGLFDWWKKPKKKEGGAKYAPTQTGYNPYAYFGDSIYASDIIVQSIRCKANEFKKLDPRHIRTTNGVQTNVTDSSIARVLRRPNSYMTMAELLEKATILYDLTKNAFVYTTYYWTKGGEKYYTGLYPLKPQTAEIYESASGKMYYLFKFANGTEQYLPQEDVIHWRKDYGVNDYFGGGITGGNDDAGLLKALKQFDQLTQSIAIALNASCKVNGVVNYDSYLADEKMEAAQADFNTKLARNESGILFTDLKSTYTNIPRDIKLVDKDTLQFFYDTILRANGCSLPILNGDYTKAQKEAYYEHALEADIKALGKAISKVVFTEREESYGNEIVLYPNSIAFMSMENKLSALQIGLPAGIFLKNEARALLGFAPMEGGDTVPQGYNNLLNSNNNNVIGGADNGNGQEDNGEQ